MHVNNDEIVYLLVHSFLSNISILKDDPLVDLSYEITIDLFL